jgi:hypothetical protein
MEFVGSAQSLLNFDTREILIIILYMANVERIII